MRHMSGMADMAERQMGYWVLGSGAVAMAALWAPAA